MTLIKMSKYFFRPKHDKLIDWLPIFITLHLEKNVLNRFQR